MLLTPLSIALFAAAAVLFLTLAILNRPAAIAVFAAILPTYLLRFSFGAGGLRLPTTFLEIIFLELFAVWFFTDGLKRGAWRGLARWAQPLVLILVGATVGALVSPDWRAGLGIWRAYFLEPILFFVVFTDVIRTPQHRKQVLAALSAVVAVIGLTAIYQQATGYGIPNPAWQALETRRVTSFFGYPNAIGLFCAPLAVFLTGWAIAYFRSTETKNRRLGILPAAAAVLGVLAVLFAVSEGGLVALAAGLFVLALFVKPLRAPALVACILACVVVMAWNPARDYASNVVSLRDDSGAVRRGVWSESLAMSADRPIFGAGLAGYQATFEPYHLAKHIEIFMYPHNLVLNFWTEIGLIGLAGFIWLFIVFFLTNARLVRELPKNWLPPALIATMLAVLVHGLVDVPYFKNDLAFMFWLLVGLAETLALTAPPAVNPPTKPALEQKERA